MKRVVIPADIATEFMDTFGEPFLPEDVGTTLNCIEVNAMAALLRALGDAEAAERWIIGHCAADDEGDAHYTQRLYYHH